MDLSLYVPWCFSLASFNILSLLGSVCVHMCVICSWVYRYVCMTCACVYVYMYVCTEVFVYVLRCVSMYVCIVVFVCVEVCVICTWICRYVCGTRMHWGICVCVAVCGGGYTRECTGVYAHVEGRAGHGVLSSFALCFIALRQDLSLNQKLTI